MEITSKNFKNNDTLPINQVYNGYGANGANLSPQLSWSNEPDETKSFAIVCHDPDAPKENGWYHWFLINIPKDIHSLDEGENTNNIIGTKSLKTDFKVEGYNGAAPPPGHGKHRYIFSVYAIDAEKLDISTDTIATTPKDIEDEIKKHSIKSASITALYER